MKRLNLVFLFFAAFGMMFFSGCSNEEKINSYDNPSSGNGKLTFVLPLGAKGPVTYGSVTGTDAEYDIKRLAIFWFKDGSPSSPQTDFLYKRFSYGEGTQLGNSITFTPAQSGGVTAGSPTALATIDIDEDNFPSKFYIIANVNGSSVLSTALSAVIPGVGGTTREEFEDLMSSALAADTINADDVRQIACPLPMSINAGSSVGGYVQLPDLLNQTPQVRLKRRVARFDVMNNAQFTNFTIKKIYVSRALTSGFLHDREFSGSSTIWSKPDSIGRFVVLDSLLSNGKTPNFNGTPCVDPSIDTNSNGKPDEFEELSGPGSNTRDSAERSAPAFYLWPTVIDNGYTKTEIVIEGSFGTAERIYRLNLGGTPEIPIEANKVYHLNVVRATKSDIDFNITVEDWEEESKVELNGNDKAIVYGDITAIDDKDTTTLIAPSGGTTAYTSYEYSSADSVTLKFSVWGTSTNGDRTGLVTFSRKPGTPYLVSDFQALQDPHNIKSVTTVTYSSMYRTDYVIKLPPSNAPVEAIMTIANASNQNDEMVTLDLKSNNYAKTGYKPVKFNYNDGTKWHTLLWAPVNVGATKFDEVNPPSFSTASGEPYVGNVFQWGRNNAAFPAYATSIPTIAGPLDSLTAAGTTNFITGTGLNWRTTDNFDLWGGVSNDTSLMRGPCPEGWRVPTIGEFISMRDSSTMGNANYYRKFTFNSSNNGRNLYIPTAGYRQFDNGNAATTSGLGSNGDYWTITPATGANAGRIQCLRVQGNNGPTTLEYYQRNYGFYIRAVREIPYEP